MTTSVKNCARDSFLSIYKQGSQRATIAHLRASIYLLGHFRGSRVANSTLSGSLGLRIKIIQNIAVCMPSLRANFKKYQINSKRTKSTFQKLKGSELPSKSLYLAEIQTHPRFNTCSHYLQVSNVTFG